MIIISPSSFESIVIVKNISSNEAICLEVFSLDNHILVGFTQKTILPLISFDMAFSA